ncbi:DUF580-domain-containing protein [Backusella circina FSU 941]|nr:DUF580-domain-containing protein [Backusella circina FSU 941]
MNQNTDSNYYYPPPPQPNGAPSQEQIYPIPPPYQQSYQNVNNAGYAELGEPQTYANDKMSPSSGFKDVWATVLFLCNFAAFIGLSIVGLRTFSQHKDSVGDNGSITLDADTARIFGFSAIVGFGFSFLYLIIANISPYQEKSKVPFATVMLKSVTAITRRYWSTLLAGIISLIVQTTYSVWFMLTVVGIYETYFEPNTSNSKLKGIMVFLVFSFYWTSQVISYVTHVTLAGVFATVYFLNDQVAHPIWGSSRRALTTSFGSICFGSLLVALINTIRYIIQVSRSETDNGLFSFLLCILDCIISCIQGIIEWFNYYAFSGVAIYGQGFIPSAKRTWSMIQDRGVEALINDNLIGNVLFMGSLLVGMLSSLLGYIYLLIVKPSYNETGGMTPMVVFICFIMGMSMFSSVATVISSGVATIFVCLAEDPEALRRSNSELYEAIRQTWPDVVQGFH